MKVSTFKIMGIVTFIALVSFGFITYNGLGSPLELSAQESEEPTVSGDDVVEHDWSEYNKTYPIENSHFVIIEGTKVADGCRVVVDGLRGAEGRSTIVRESAFKPSSCEYLMEVGDMSAKAEEAHRQRRSKTREDDSSSSENPSSAKPLSEDYHRNPILNRDFPDQADFPGHGSFWDAVNFKTAF